MTNYDYSAYGSNPNSGRNANANLDWGSYCWPGGVPSNLLGTARFEDVSLSVRTELVELVTLLMQYTDQEGYDLRGTENTKAPAGNWCWGYSNRAISGTNTPSNHSKGKAVDLNAPTNPYTSPLVCDIPPKIVNAWEKAGFFWGGRYSGSKDAMHFEYCWCKTDVAGDVSYVKSLLSGKPPVPPDIPIPEGTPLPLIVKRLNGAVDYAWADDMSFIVRIPTQAFYSNLEFAGVIATPHGKAPSCDQGFIDWFEGCVASRQGVVWHPNQ